MRRLFAGVPGLAVALLMAPAALASTATINGGDTVRVTSTGETNSIAVAYSAATDTYTVVDIAANLGRSGACVQVDSHTVTCPGAGVNKVSVDTGSGNDVITLDRPTIPIGLINTLNGGNGNDIINGGRGRDNINGEGGNDLVDGHEGADDMNGGGNTDTILYTDRTTPLNVTIGSLDGNDGNELDLTGAGRDTVHGDIEALVGGSAGDTVVGDNTGEFLVGSLGNDVLIGLGGGDQLLGLGGDDLLGGGSGNDVARGEFGNDRVLGGPDNDRLTGGPDNDFIRGKKGFDVMKGNTGLDAIGAKDGFRDVKINCGPGPRGLEGAKRDKRLDPKPKSC